MSCEVELDFGLLFTIRAFLFPEDQQIELEYWAETGEFSSTDLYQMKVRHVFFLKTWSDFYHNYVPKFD